MTQATAEARTTAEEAREARIDALVQAGCTDLAEHLRDAAANGRRYIEAYAAFLVSPKRACPPQARGIHPEIARLIRELMLDLEVGRRWSR